MSKRIVLSLLLAAVTTALLAQNAASGPTNPVPAPKQSAPILILGATAHIGNGSVIPNSAIAFEKGKLTLVADATTIRIDRNKYSRIFDATGKHVYPGFIGMNTQLGLVEIDAARPTVDFADIGQMNANLRAIIAYNTDSEVIPTVRSNGVLMAQTTPQGGVLSGASGIVQLDAWNWEDAAVLQEDGQHLNWPAPRAFGGFESGNPEMRRNDQYEKDVQSIRRYFEAAKAYCLSVAPETKNLKFEAMRGLFDKKIPLYVHTDNARTIQESVLFAESLGMRPVIVGGSDSWLVTDFLYEHQTAVVLSKPQRLPSREDEDIDQPYKTPAQLQAKGVLFSLVDAGAWRQRNLPFEAGQAVGFGLPYEAAVAAITLNPAKIMGIDAFAGSLETGKDATLFISEGDALDPRTARVTAAFIQGREISLDDKHKQLNRRYEEKYKQN